MKNIISTLAIIVCIVESISTLYGSELDNKSINADNNLKTHNIMTDVKQDVNENRIDALSVYHKFLKDAAIKINQNKKSFAQFKVKLSKMNRKDNSNCWDQAKGLEQNNNKLKTMLAIHKTDKRQYQWATNIIDFNNDMDQLETSMWSMN